MDEEHDYPRTLKFRLGWNTITATGDLIDPFYPHVIKASLHLNVWHRCISLIVQHPWMPNLLRRAIQHMWPRYALPGCVVLKKLRKPEHTYSFEHETEMYQRLIRAQGNLVPTYYGEANCEGDRTKVLSFFPYPTVPAISKPLSACMSVDEFTTRITMAIDEMIRRGGVVQEDDKLNNVLVADDGHFVFVDLEAVYAPNDKVGPEWTRKYAIDGLVDQYKQYIAILKEEEDDEASWRARQTSISTLAVVESNSPNH